MEIRSTSLGFELDSHPFFLFLSRLGFRHNFNEKLMLEVEVRSLVAPYIHACGSIVNKTGYLKIFMFVCVWSSLSSDGIVRTPF